MTEQEEKKLIYAAVDHELQARQDHKPGTIVAHKDYEFTVTLVHYEGDVAVCDCKHAGRMTFPRNEVFSVKRIMAQTQSFMALGMFMPPGIEATVITLTPKDAGDI